MNQNPIQTMVQMMNMGQNPMSFLQQMAGVNLQVAQMMKMINGKSEQQLRGIAENMARERGLSVEDVARSVGISIPSNR